MRELPALGDAAARRHVALTGIVCCEAHGARTQTSPGKVLTGSAESHFSREDADTGLTRMVGPRRVTEDSGWAPLKSPEYAEYSAAFLSATQSLLNAARRS